MTSAKRPFTRNRLRTAPKIKPLDPKAKLAPHRAPIVPAGKFEHCEGQMAMDFASDDPDALVEP